MLRLEGGLQGNEDCDLQGQIALILIHLSPFLHSIGQVIFLSMPQSLHLSDGDVHVSFPEVAVTCVFGKL